ncbi:hypothetical protein Ddc_10139 [Ditylenchus destructor]|nr:hypothetical protein Ddc_10139 [Ditylenchus destructor]
MTKTSIISYLAVVYSILVSLQLLAAQSSPYDETQALGAKAAATMKNAEKESLAKISAAAGGLPKNKATVSDATSKIAAAVKDGQTAMDSAMATAKSALDAAGADQTAINAAKAGAVTAINAALAAAVTTIDAATAAATTALKAN